MNGHDGSFAEAQAGSPQECDPECSPKGVSERSLERRLECSQNRHPERRTDPRYSIDEDAILQIVGHSSSIRARIVNLSQEGCRLRTREEVFVRSRWPLEITFKVNGVAFHFNAVVEWTDDAQNLLGIRFVNMVPRHMLELAEIICAMEVAAWLNDRGGGNQSVAAPDGSPTANAVELPPEIALRPAQPSAPRDRRAQSRHEVDTSVLILLVKIASTLRGRIIDLSMGGCRIRTDQRFPVGIYTRVEIEFRLESIPFRLGGVIQAIHDRHTVGIRFLDLSERKRLQVAELIGEIREMREA